MFGPDDLEPDPSIPPLTENIFDPLRWSWLGIDVRHGLRNECTDACRIYLYIARASQGVGAEIHFCYRADCDTWDTLLASDNWGWKTLLLDKHRELVNDVFTTDPSESWRMLWSPNLPAAAAARLGARQLDGWTELALSPRRTLRDNTSRRLASPPRKKPPSRKAKRPPRQVQTPQFFATRS